MDTPIETPPQEKEDTNKETQEGQVKSKLDLFEECFSGQKDKDDPEKARKKKELRDAIMDTCKNKKMVTNVIKTMEDDPELKYKAEMWQRKMGGKNGVVKINAHTASKEDKKMARTIQNAKERTKFQIAEDNIICVNMLINGKLSPYDAHESELIADKYIIYPAIVGDIPFAVAVKNIMFDGVSLGRNKVAELLINDTARKMGEEEGQIKGPVLFIKLNIGDEDKTSHEDISVSEFKELLNSVKLKAR